MIMKVEQYRDDRYNSNNIWNDVCRCNTYMHGMDDTRLYIRSIFAKQQIRRKYEEVRKENEMIKVIRILEVPIYLLVISLFCFENNSPSMGTFLILISIARLWTNHITDDTIYRGK